MPTRITTVQPVLMSRDVERSIRFFVQSLGFTLAFQVPDAAPTYAGVRRDEVELHLQWQDSSHWESPGDRPTYRFLVADVDALAEELRARDPIAAMTPVADTAWGTREFHVHDPDRNGLQFYQPRQGKERSPSEVPAD